MNYNNKKFKPLNGSANSETNDKTIFHYQQTGNIVSATYSGGNITQGQLLGLVDSSGCITMRYHQINTSGEITTGNCVSNPEIMANGKVRLHEKWQWTSGDQSEGFSILEEI